MIYFLVFQFSCYIWVSACRFFETYFQLYADVDDQEMYRFVK